MIVGIRPVRQVQPAYARVKIWRRLQAIGALALGKNALYVLPARRSLLSAFEAILEEARRVKGDAVIFTATVISGYRDEQICALFERDRAAEYESLMAKVRALDSATENHKAANGAEALAQRARRVAHAHSIEARDFFASPMHKRAVAALEALEQPLRVRRDAGA